MSTFKTALRMALAHPFYLLIYTVFISLMGVFIAASVSWNSSQLTEYEPYDANVIVVDRDDSDLSRALTKHLGLRFELVTGVDITSVSHSHLDATLETVSFDRNSTSFLTWES